MAKEVWPELTASGCADGTISFIVKGHYKVSSMNHGRPVYKKQEKAKGMDVLIYFWDDRDGLDESGWWFGPAVGGDQVWAFNPSRSSLTPPSKDWNVPNDGDIDPTFSIVVHGSAATKQHGRSDEVSDEANVRQRLEILKAEQKESEKQLKELQASIATKQQRITSLRRKRLPEGDTAFLRPHKKADSSGTKQRRDEEAEQLRLREDKRKQEEEEEEEQERQRQTADQVRLKELELSRKKEEAKRQQDRQRQLNEEAKKRKEEVAVLATIEAIGRMTFAQPEDFEAVQELYESVKESLLHLTGRKQASLKSEAKRMLERAYAYTEKARELKAEYEEWQNITRQPPTSQPLH
mmetsp:Transcript_70630/g.147952  ORF Transcript_70630/g.147952 Transcript_70630/m.147952 type:complete len:351 (+) Transcript_70630:71-1123(+)